MIDVVFFSVAGNQEIPEITELFERWNNSEIVPKVYKDALKYTLDIVREGGHYPAKEYYDMYFQDSGQYYASVVELQHYAKIVDDYFERAHIQEEITKTLNTAKSADELKASLSALIENSMEQSVDEDDKPILYSETVETPHGEGLTTGIQPVDQLTNGFQPGTVATIAGFTGHGKCLDVSERVSTNFGYLSGAELIELLKVKEGTQEVEGLLVEQSDGSYHEVSHTYYQKSVPTIKIRTKYDSSVQATPHHKVLAFRRGEMYPSMCRMDSLKEGDFVLKRISSFSPDYDNDFVKYFLYGALLGDGVVTERCFRNKRISLLGSKEDLVVADSLLRRIGYVSPLRVYTRKGHCEMQFDPIGFLSILKPSDAYSKEIDKSCFYNKSRSFATLLGLLVTDGSISNSSGNSRVEITTVSAALKRSLLDLLDYLGIPYSVKIGMGRYKIAGKVVETKWNYRIQLRSQFYERYWKQIKDSFEYLGVENCRWARLFVGEYSLRVAPRRMFTEGSINLSRDLYSNLIGVCNRGCNSCEHYYGDKNCRVKSWIASLRRGVSLRTVGNVLQFYKDKHCGVEDTKLLSENINKFNVSLYHDYFAEEIVSVEHCLSDVFDVTVPSTHLFMAKGFVNHNTQATISIIFRNAKKGKKCVYLSLEMPKEQVWMMFQARWLYEVHNLSVTSTDLIQRKLTKEMLAKVKSLEPQYLEEFASNIIICDSSVLPKGISKTSAVWVLLYKSWERKLKGLDLVAHDHIGQYDRLFPDEGNNIIKMITDATVNFQTKVGNRVVSLFACQCNRDGLKRATKRNGVYDVTAISDLNECGHSDTITTVACEGKRGLTFGQVRKRFKEGRKLTVDCVDYSTGKVVSSIVEDAFVTGRVNPEYTWRKLTYEGSGKSIVLTDTHRVLVEGIKVPLNSLPNSFRADCVGWVLTKESEQVLLGTLLGDSTISETEGTDKGTWSVRMYQGKKQKEYLQWKKNMLGEFMHDIKPHGVKFVSCSNSCKELVKYSWTKTRGLKGITYENLIKIEPLGLLVWYLDDGCKVNYSKGSYGVVLACTNFGESGARIMQKVLLDKFGLESKVVVREERRSKKNCVRIELGAVSARKFLDLVSPLIDIECIQYKLDNSRVSKNPVEPNPPYRGVIKQGLFVTQREVKMSCKKYLSKYNFTVSHPDHNYVLPGGLVSSNCERASAYIVFLYTPEDKAISQETVVTLAKHRLGTTLSEPTPVAFVPSVSIVGSTVEQISYTDDLSSLGEEFGDFGGGGDFSSGDLDI